MVEDLLMVSTQERLKDHMNQTERNRPRITRVIDTRPPEEIPSRPTARAGSQARAGTQARKPARAGSQQGRRGAVPEKRGVSPLLAGGVVALLAIAVLLGVFYFTSKINTAAAVLPPPVATVAAGND